MYSQQDMDGINARIRKNALALAPVLAVLLAAYVYALKAGVKWLAMVVGPLLFVAACYGILAYLWPNIRYRRFLIDLERGLTRTVEGTILDISDVPELQDGARVLTVRLAADGTGEGEARHASALAERLRAEQPEPAEDGGDVRILYLNASKREGFPGPGARVSLVCSGRHIRQVNAA